MTREVKLTTQHQITIPKQICTELKLHGGDRLEIILTAKRELMLKPKKMIDANDRAYRLGSEILQAEEQIAKGQTTAWTDIKRRHRL